MPTYQYSCTECGHFFEAVQSFSDDSLTVCPQCQGRLRKVFNAVGVVFKGSGFYRTDSRATNGNGSNGSGKATEKSGSGDSAASKGSTDGGSGSGSSTSSDSGSTKSTTTASAGAS